MFPSLLWKSLSPGRGLGLGLGPPSRQERNATEGYGMYITKALLLANICSTYVLVLLSQDPFWLPFGFILK